MTTTAVLPAPATTTPAADADLVTCDFGQHLADPATVIDCGDCQAAHCDRPQCDADHDTHHNGGVL